MTRPGPSSIAAIIDRTLAALETQRRRDRRGAGDRHHQAGARARGEPLIAGTVERRLLWRAQTPQAFRYRAILAAHRAGGRRRAHRRRGGGRVGGARGILGDGCREQLQGDDRRRSRAGRGAARARGAASTIRTATGFDVHRFDRRRRHHDLRRPHPPRPRARGPFRCRCRPACADRRAARRHRRRRHRRAFPAGRRALARRRLEPLHRAMPRS